MRAMASRFAGIHRRGEVGSGTLATLIILGLTFILILIIWYRLSFLTQSDVDKRLCETTVSLQSVTKLSVAGASKDSPFHVSCKRRTVDITPNGATFSYEGSDKKQTFAVAGKPLKYTAIDSTSFSTIAAESMTRCWDQAGAGKSAVLNDRTVWANANVCLICDEIHVTLPNGVASIDTQPSYLSSFLAGTNMPKDPDNLNRTYGGYLFPLTPLTTAGVDVLGWLPSNTVYRTTTADALLSALKLRNPGMDDATLSGGKLCIYENNIDENPVIESGTYATVFFRDFSKFDSGCMNTYIVPATQLRWLCDYVAN